METHIRAAVAYVAARLVSGAQFSSIYDYSEKRYRTIDGTVSEQSVEIYDYEGNAYFGGMGSGGSFSLYDYGYKHYVDLKIDGNKFEGYDYGSKKYYSGEAADGLSSISLYDHAENKYFQYSR